MSCMCVVPAGGINVSIFVSEMMIVWRAHLFLGYISLSISIIKFVIFSFCFIVSSIVYCLFFLPLTRQDWTLFQHLNKMLFPNHRLIILKKTKIFPLWCPTGPIRGHSGNPDLKFTRQTFVTAFGHFLWFKEFKIF